MEPRRQNARIVEHEQVAWGEQCRQIDEPSVLEGSALRIEHEQPACAALGERRLRN
jgi:hypothetical protein